MDSTTKKVNKWFIAIKKRDEQLFDFKGLKRWETPKGGYEADPFLIKHKGKNYLFYEKYDYKKGIICYSMIDKLSISPPNIALELPYHASYPFIFEEGGEIYLIPETGIERNIQLFKAKKFPNKWELVKVLWEDGNFADSNIIKYKGNWWLFTIGGNDNNLTILTSKALIGKWEKHFEEMIPNSRGAGNIIGYKKQLIRPVQDTSLIYGGAIIFKEVTLPEYTEKDIARIEPFWYPKLIGTHTFNFNKDYVVIDGKIQV